MVKYIRAIEVIDHKPLARAVNKVPTVKPNGCTFPSRNYLFKIAQILKSGFP